MANTRIKKSVVNEAAWRADILGMFHDPDAVWTSKEIAKVLGGCPMRVSRFCQRLQEDEVLIDVKTSRQRLPRWKINKG